MQFKVLGLQGATSIDLVAAATQKMAAEDINAVLAKTALEKADLKAILRMRGLSEAEAENTAQTIINSRANTTAAASTNAYTTSTNSLKVAFKGLGAAIKTNPILLLITLLPAAIGLINHIKEKIEEARNAAIEAGQTIADNSTQLSALIDDYKKLAQQGINDVESRNSAAKIQQQIVDLVGAQASNLDLVNGKLDDELGKLQQINKEVTDVATLQAAYENAKDKTGEKRKVHVKSWVDIDTSSADISISEGQMPSFQSGQRQTVLKIIKDAVGDYGNAYNLPGSAAIEAYFKNIAEDDYKTRLEIYNEIVENLRENGFTSDDAVFSQFLTQRNELQSLYNEQSKAANNLLSGLIQNKYFEQETDVSSLEEYIALRNEIINEINNEGTVQDMIADNSISNDDVENKVDAYLGGLNQYSDYYKEWYNKFGSDIAKTTEKIKNELLKSGDAKDVNGWINGLTDEEKEIIFKIETKYGDDNNDWSLEKWKEELTNWEIPKEVKFSFSDLIKDEDFKDKVDEYKDKITELDDTLEKLRGGDLSEEDQIKLFENFPELAGQADNLDEAIVNLIDSLESDAIDDFNDKLDYMETDDDVAALNALKNSILGLAKTKNGVTDLKSEISKLKTTLDDLSNTYSDMKSIVDDYNENGYLTLDNLQSIMDLEPQYVNLLIDENGQINLNSQAYKEYIAAKAKALLVDELKDLYSTVLNMKLEEAQAYANAEAYNAETRSVKDLLAATTELYLIKAKQKDLANNTTVYTDAMSRSFNTAANYAAMVDSYINSLSTSQNEFSVSTEQATSALEAEKDALEAQKDALNDSKDALEDYKDGLSDAQSKIKDLIDLVQDYIKQMKENEMDALSDQIDALEEQKDNYSEIISQKKEAIELAKQEREEAEKLSDLQQAVAKDTLSLAVANLDDSSAGRKAQKVAKDKLIQSNKDLQDELNQQAYDKRIEALEKDEEEYSNHIDKRIEALNKEKDAIQEYLDNVRQLYEDACNMIDNDTGDLYGKLWNDYVYPYTTQTRAEFDNLWYSAQEAIQRYIGDNNNLIGVMEYLQTEIYNTDEQIGELELQIGDLETAIDNTNSMIDNTSTSIDNVSTSLDGLGTTIADYMAQLAELQAAANNIDVNPNPGGEKTKFYVTHNGKTYETGYNYNGDTEGNRLLAAAELTKQIAKDISGFDQYGLGIVQGYLGVGTGGAKEWYVDLNGHRYTAVSKTKDNAIKQIMAQGIDPRAGYYVRDHIQHYATGTYSSVGGVAITQENNRLEEIFGKLQNGQYTMLSEGSHVLDSQATNNLHRFADNPPEFVAQALNYSGYLGKVENAVRNVVRNIDNHSSGNTEVSAPISISIQGDASQSTVKAIEKAGREIETRIIKKLVRFGNINKKPMY